MQDKIPLIDERFIGWGYEDHAMNIKFDMKNKNNMLKLFRHFNTTYHLYHPPSRPENIIDLENRKLYEEYRKNKNIDNGNNIFKNFDINDIGNHYKHK
jgi:hypothetical protein